MTSLALDVEKATGVANFLVGSGIGGVFVEDESLDGKHVTVYGKKLIHFGSCGYLGLEYDERLKAGAIQAIERFGTQFSCSRAYLSLPLYEEVEDKLAKMYGYPALLAPSCTLGHISNIPVLCTPKDAIILDHQVHTSVRNAVSMAKASGTHVEVIRHNNMNTLEDRIKHLSSRHEKIWYMADGIYSMLGDVAPIDEIYTLMDKYPQFYCYIDDAHGMSWKGKNGTGIVFLGGREYHPQLFFVTSLAKGFGVSGGVMLYHTDAMKQLIRFTGLTMVFGGPMQPANLGAISASADIHLSPEIYVMQSEFSTLMSYFKITARALNLPLISEGKSPIFYIGLGSTEAVFEVCSRMISSGYFVSFAAYPSVPEKLSGVRITLNLSHTVQEIHEMLTALAGHIAELESKNKVNIEKVYNSFGLAQ